MYYALVLVVEPEIANFTVTPLVESIWDGRTLTIPEGRAVKITCSGAGLYPGVLTWQYMNTTVNG